LISLAELYVKIKDTFPSTEAPSQLPNIYAFHLPFSPACPLAAMTHQSIECLNI